MTAIEAYHNIFSPHCRKAFSRSALAALLLVCLLPCCGFSQAEPQYDEVPVMLNVPLVGSIEIMTVITNEVAYLPVNEMFNFLKIRNTLTPNVDSVSGYFVNPDAYFVIDKVNDRIVFNNLIYPIRPSDLIATELNLYLRSDYFGRIFGLDCKFDFRSLSVTLTTKLDLPVVREMRQNMMRTNMSRLRENQQADTTIARRNPLFQLGMADWSVTARQQDGARSETRLNLSLGSFIAGGETNLGFNYNLNERFDERQQNYSWKLVNNNNPFMRQFLAGKFYPQSISTIYSPVFGVNFTNTPTTYRRSFGTYRLSNVTEPGWMVELYVNDILVSYVKADASGFFTFDVPLVYGNTVVKLRFYGPWGEERTREGNVTIPFNFLPPGELEYNVSAGVVEDGQRSRFSRANFNYGLSRLITVGGGLEYLASLTPPKSIPFVNTAMRLTSNLMLSAEYAYGVRSKGIISYRLPSNLQVEMNYIKYKRGQQSIKYNYLHERNLLVSMPFRYNSISGFSRLTFNQKIMPSVTYTTGELLLTAMLNKASVNLTTFTMYTEPVHPYLYSNLSLSYRLPHQLTITPQVQYEFSRKMISMVKGQVEKRFLSNGYLILSYEKNFYYRTSNFGLGVRMDFSFAQTGFSTSIINKATSYMQSARGSLLYDQKNNTLGATSRPNVGRGGIVMVPFLDLNGNGKRENSEPKAYGLKVRLRNGYAQYNSKDTTIRVLNLEPYTKYYIALDSNSFDNIAWKLKHKSISIAVNANMLTTVDIPVTVTGEVSGMVYLSGKQEQKGQARMIVNIFRNDSTFVARMITESDGYFSFLGLEPGKYTAVMDRGQLQKLQLEATPASVPFTIRRSKEGDVAEGLKITLHAIKKEKVPEGSGQEP